MPHKDWEQLVDTQGEFPEGRLSPTCMVLHRAPAHGAVQVVEHIVCNLVSESHPIVDGQREMGAHVDPEPCMLIVLF